MLGLDTKDTWGEQKKQSLEEEFQLQQRTFWYEMSQKSSVLNILIFKKVEF